MTDFNNQKTTQTDEIKSMWNEELELTKYKAYRAEVEEYENNASMFLIDFESNDDTEELYESRVYRTLTGEDMIIYLIYRTDYYTVEEKNTMVFTVEEIRNSANPIDSFVAEIMDSAEYITKKRTAKINRLIN